MDAKITISLDEKMKARLKEMAWEERRSLSDFLRMTLEQALKLKDSSQEKDKEAA